MGEYEMNNGLSVIERFLGLFGYVNVERLNACRADLIDANAKILFLRTLVDSRRTCMSRKEVKKIFGW